AVARPPPLSPLAPSPTLFRSHAAESETTPEAGLGRILWAQVHGYLNEHYGFSRLPAGRFGSRLFRWLPPLGLKLDYYARHLSVRSEEHTSELQSREKLVCRLL